MTTANPTVVGSVSRMRALVSDGSSVRLRSIRIPPVSAAEVLVEVRAVGLCRTDLYAISGEIPAKQPLVPGHEFAGIVASVGADVEDLKRGDRVVVDPRIGCGSCSRCSAGPSVECLSQEFLGVDRDGACAEFVVVPAASVVQLPDGMSFLTAAFAEPVAATLAVLNAEIHPDQLGLVFGDSQIATLALRVLQAHGFTRTTLSTDSTASLPDGCFDFIVETQMTTESVPELMRLLRPRGRIVLKSRQPGPVSFVFRDLVAKEPVIEFVNYGQFDLALQLLTCGSVRVDDLIGRQYCLDEATQAVAEARCDEQRKTFLLPRVASRA